MRTCTQRLVWYGRCRTIRLTCIDILFMRSLLLPTNMTGWKVSVFSWHSRNNGIHLSLTFCRLASSTTENTRHTTSAWRICSHSSSWSCSFSEEKTRWHETTNRTRRARQDTHRDNRLCPWAPVRALLRPEWLSFRHDRAPRPGILRWPATVWWMSCRRRGRPPKGCAPTVRSVSVPSRTKTLFGWNTNVGQHRSNGCGVADTSRIGEGKNRSPRESHRRNPLTRTVLEHGSTVTALSGDPTIP